MANYRCLMKPVGTNLIIILNFFATTYSCTSTMEDAEDTLQSSHGAIIFSAVVFNHGDQFPEILFSVEENPLEDLSDELGLLTQNGKMRAFNLGRWTRKRYDFLIKNKPYSSSLLQIISSSYDRTVSSGQLFLAGFYPPTCPVKEIWNEKIPWQPISILSLPRLHDRMIFPTEYCARINMEVDRIMNSLEIKNFYDKHKNLFDYIRKHIEINVPEGNIVQTMNKLNEVYGSLRIQKQARLPLSEWAENIYNSLAQTMPYFKEKIYNELVIRLRGGPLLEHIIKQFKRKQTDQHFSRLFQFYVGHDTTIMLLLKILGLSNDELIQFGAAVFIELRLTLSDEYTVTVSYKNGDVAPQLLELRFCSPVCILNDFIKLVENIIPKNWEKECKSLEPDYNTMNILF